MDNRDTNYYKNEFPKKREIWVKHVSRTFALSIKILPADLRGYIGHAYLICRLLDTLEDAPDLSVAKKHEALDMAIVSINDADSIHKNSGYFANIAATSDIVEWEKILLNESVSLFECLLFFPEDIRQTIRTWSTEMAVGMKKYAFGTDKPDIQLQTIQELDEYTYYVAGTVGKLLSEMFSRACYKIPAGNQIILHQNAVQFGKALQLVNIIKDSRADIKEGRCFIPKELFEKYNSSIGAFLDVTNRDTENIKGVFRELIRYADGYLENALQYIHAVPIRNWRIRLGCIWPVVLAYKTLKGLEKDLDHFVTGSTTFKISRKEVKRILLTTFPSAFSNRSLDIYINKIKSL